jgi:hypothetical protein
LPHGFYERLDVAPSNFSELSEHGGEVEFEGDVGGGFSDAEQRAQREPHNILLADAARVFQLLL